MKKNDFASVGRYSGALFLSRGVATQSVPFGVFGQTAVSEGYLVGFGETNMKKRM